MSKVDYLRKRFADAFRKSNYVEAADIGKNLLSELSRNGRVGTEGYINDTYNLALAYEKAGNIKSASEAYKSSVWHSSNYDSESLLFARCLTSYATLLSEAGAVETAYFMYAKACDIKSKKLKSGDPLFADSLYNLANAACEMDMTDIALDYHMEALEIREKNGDCADIVNSLHSIAYLHEKNKALDKACEYAKQAVSHAIDIEDDLTYPRACIYLAELYAKNNKNDDALEMYSFAVEEIDLMYGKEHSAYLNTAFTRATLLGIESYYPEAEEAYREILDIFHSLLGPNHMFYANCLRNLALLYEKQGALLLSRDTILKVVKIKQKLGSCFARDIISVLRLNLKMGHDGEALQTLVYALMHSDKSALGHETCRDLIISVVSNERKNDSEAFFEMVNDLEDAPQLEDIINYWKIWENTPLPDTV